MKEITINRENIQKMVDSFYPKVLKDEIVGPFFIQKLGSDINSKEWQEHLKLLGDFWAMTSLGDLTYQGSPLAPHFNLPGISKEAFIRWLTLFHQTVDEVYEGNAAEFFKQRSTNIANNFMINLGL